MSKILTSTEVFMSKAKQHMDAWNHRPDGMSEEEWFELRALRLSLLAEEFQEYVTAEANHDLVQIVDGLLDVIVIAWGTLLAYVGPEKATSAAGEVARSNLAKVIGEGLPIFREDGKVLKPEGWTPPDIGSIVWES